MTLAPTRIPSPAHQYLISLWYSKPWVAELGHLPATDAVIALAGTLLLRAKKKCKNYRGSAAEPEAVQSCSWHSLVESKGCSVDLRLRSSPGGRRVRNYLLRRGSDFVDDIF